jgi:Kef-type K+ transport system membrane component KefB
MTNIFLFLSLSFIFVFFVGKLLEKFRVPWIFSALILGSILAINNPFFIVTDSESFILLAQLGMYFLLFMIGLELDLNELKNKKGFIFKSTIFIILLEAIFGSLLIHFLFDYALWISFLVSLSFATVGEAILIPILDEFKMVNTKLGQAIIGIGTVDDILEMIILIILSLVIGNSTHVETLVVFGSLSLLFIMTIGFRKLGKKQNKFSFKNVDTLFFFVISVFLIFICVGSFSDATSVAALLAGVSMRTFIPQKRFKLIDSEIKSMAYGFFVPIFFIWVGVSMDFGYILKYPLAILAVVLVSNSAKIIGSYIVAHKELGKKESVLLGIGLSVRFSTSIVIIKILFDKELIGIDLYSIIIASSIVFKFLVPLLFSKLIVKWKLNKVF